MDIKEQAMTPTTAQIDRGCVAAKAMIPMNEVPFMFKHLITDDKIREAVTKVLTAALNAPTAGAAT
jgi:hypothetical protein